MKIIAASIQTAIESFLHAGYGSAAPVPHGLAGGAFSGEPTLLQLDLAEALRLAGESTAASQSTITASGGLGGTAEGAAQALNGAAGIAGTLDGSTRTLLSALGVLGLAAVVAAIHRLAPRLARPRARLAAASLAGVICAAALVWVALAPGLARAGPEANGPAPPATPSTPQPSALGAAVTAAPTAKRAAPAGPYARPEAATEALLHGILAGALVNRALATRSLAELRDRIALPTAKPTRGQRYALEHYDRDGWGRPWRFEIHGTWQPYRYVVTSAGADGRHDTADDLGLEVWQADLYRWTSQRHALFLARHGDELVVLFRRADFGSFVARHAKLAETLTGSAEFDALRERDLSDDLRAKLQAAYESYDQPSSDRPTRPLPMVVPSRPALLANTAFHYASMRRRHHRRRFGFGFDSGW